MQTLTLSLACVVLLIVQSPAQTLSSAVLEVGKSFGFTPAELDQIRQGAILSKGLKEGSDKELAGVVAVFLPKAVGEFTDFVFEGKLQKLDSEIRELQVWKPDKPVDPKTFASLQLGSSEQRERQMYLQAAPGSKLNLADAEIAQFKKLAPNTANAGIQAMLVARSEAYREEGLKGILPYARGGKKASSPGEELGLAIQETKTLDRVPGYSKALLQYPRNQLRGIEHRFYCYQQEVGERPAFILSHRARLRGEHDALITEQRFYVSHTYDCRFIASDCLEVPGGMMLFYVNRTFTDQVAGMGSGLKHSAGRKRMLADVAANLKKVREQLRK